VGLGGGRAIDFGWFDAVAAAVLVITIHVIHTSRHDDVLG
jgi:hypothetical protein